MDNKLKVIKLESKNKDKSKQEQNNNKKNIRYHLKLTESTSYYFAIDIESEDDILKNNTKAISMAWNIITNKLVDLDSIKIGSGFSQEILKKEEVESEIKNKND